MNARRATSAVDTRRTITARPGTSRQTVFTGKSGKPEKATDTRKIRDNDYVKQEAERVYNYLKQMGYDPLPEQKRLEEGLSLRPFMGILTFLVEQMGIEVAAPDEDCKDMQVQYDFIAKISQLLNYPETNQIKQTELKSCSTSTYWRKFLALLCWLTELSDYLQTSALAGPGDDGVVEKFVFVERLCQSGQPEALLESREYFDFAAQIYAEFLADGGSEEKLKASLQNLFDVWTYDAKSRQEIMTRDIEKVADESRLIVSDLQTQLLQAQNDLEAAASHAARCQIEFNYNPLQFPLSMQNGNVETYSGEDESFDGAFLLQQLQDLRTSNLAAIETAATEMKNKITTLETCEIPQLIEQLNFSQTELEQNNRKLEEIYKQLAAAHDVVKNQPISYGEYNRIVFKHTNKQDKLKQLEDDLNDLNTQINNRISVKNSLNRNIQTLCQSLMLNPNINLAELSQKLQELRAECLNLERNRLESFNTLSELDSKKLALAQECTKLEENLNVIKMRVVAIHSDVDESMASKQHTNEHYSAQIDKLINEIKELKETQQKMDADIDESKQMLDQQQIVVQRENQRLESEEQKLVTIVSTIYQQIINSRSRARNSLEMVRDLYGQMVEQVRRDVH